MPDLALSRMLGARVLDGDGAFAGRVREVALTPQADGARISALIVRTPQGDRLVSADSVSLTGEILFRVASSAGTWAKVERPDELFLLERDLLDQQIIDVHGRKVVRVNDVDLKPGNDNGKGLNLRVAEVDVGTRGAVRRLLKGV